MAFLPHFHGLDEKNFTTRNLISVPFVNSSIGAWEPRGVNREGFDAALEQITNTCRRMDRALESGSWLVGDTYTLADVIVAPLIDRMEDLGFAYLWESDFRTMTYWFACVKKRSAF